MPSVSQKQAKFFRIAAHNKEFAERMGIDQKVAKEWVKKDKQQSVERLPIKASKEHYPSSHW